MIEEQLKRKMVELNLSAAGRRKSIQTGFVHYWIQDPFAPKQDTIPVLENFIYAYALFRSKLVGNIQEGKEILEKLLAFEVNGNFPVALHEFPVCRDKQLASELLPPLFYLLRDYPLALGDLGTQKLKALSLRIVKGLESQVDSLSIAAKGRLNAFLGVFDPSCWKPRSSSEWGEFCICAQMAEIDFSEIARQWDSDFCVFIGDTKERQHEEYEPSVTLFDLFMGEYFQSFSKRALLSIESPSHLKAALVHPFELRHEGQKKGAIGFRCLIEELSKQCLTLYWGSAEKVHSCVLEAKKGTWTVDCKQEGVIDCLYTYDELMPSEDDRIEIGLYINDSEEHVIEISDEKATVFHPQDELIITSKNLKLFFDIESKTSGMQWMGHLLKGDRLFQRGRKLPYGGYDWKLGIRTIKRESKAQILIKVKIELM